MENFNEIYSKYYRKIYTHINVRVKSSEDVEELTNDVFLKVYKHLESYDASKAQINTWIYFITNNVIIDYFRKKKLETTDVAMFTDDGEAKEIYSMSTNETPLAVIVRKEMSDNVQRQLRDLPASVRDVASLFFNKDLSHEQISIQLDLPLGTVKGYIYRAREILKTKLVPEYA